MKFVDLSNAVSKANVVNVGIFNSKDNVKSPKNVELGSAVLDNMSYQGDINKAGIKKSSGMPREQIDKYAQEDGYTACDKYVDGHHIIYTSDDADIDDKGRVMPKLKLQNPKLFDLLAIGAPKEEPKQRQMLVW